MSRVKATAVLVTALVWAGLAAPAAAASPLHAHVEAESVRSEGISLLSAPLAALLQESHAAPGSPPGFRLTADSVVVETTTRDPTIHVAEVSMGVDPATTSRELHAATFEGTRARLDDRLDVFAIADHPAPQLHAQTGCSEWATPGSDTVRRDPRIPTPAARTGSATVGEGARLGDCEASTWTVTGEFLVMLWERDFAVTSPEGKEAMQSGRLAFDPQRSAGDGSDSQPTSRDQEVYLYVSGGTLRIPMDAGTVAYVGPGAALTGAAGLQVRKATFQIVGSGMPVQASALGLDGSLDLALGRTGSRLSLEVQGTLASGHADGQGFGGHGTPALASQPALSSWSTGALGALGAMALAGLAIVGSAAKEARPAKQMGRKQADREI